MTAHVCTYFDDGDIAELSCVCGGSAVVLVLDDGETLLVPVEADAPVLSKTAWSAGSPAEQGGEPIALAQARRLGQLVRAAPVPGRRAEIALGPGTAAHADPGSRRRPVLLLVAVGVGIGVVWLAGDDWRSGVVAFLRQLARAL